MENYRFKSNVNKEMKELMLSCVERCKAINIPINTNLEFQMDSAERRNGFCQHNRFTGIDLISISKHLTDIKEIENTIFHELLHTCPGCNNHGYVWQKYGRQIERAYGQHIQRLNAKKRELVDVRHSRRKYFTYEEYLNNKDILQAFTREGETKPIWFCKKGSKTAYDLEYNCTSHGKKIVQINV